MPTETALQRYVLNGGVMMIFLVPLALLMIAFVIQGFINLRRGRICPRNYAQRLAQKLGTGISHRKAEEMLESENHSIGLILRRVLRHLEFKADADPAELLRTEIEEECAAVQQRNSQLAVVYNVAPLMGLLGTVFGMIRTFRDFTASADPSIRELSTGINLALLTTAWGLSIAIPAFLFLYIFARRINTYEQVILQREGSDALHVVLRAIGFEQASRSTTSIPREESD
ncbi:MotA/TolQ/ExbB proton channel family protein [bacterium]|nr:MotA/TolQ/ExbB proton channel family protein [bacterium]